VLSRTRSAFTLIELLVVMAIVAILLVLLVPAFTAIKHADEVTNSAYALKGILEQARASAMANDTYVWVGFYEENSTTSTPTSVAPPYPGFGRLVIAIVSSKDGTKIFDNSDPVASLPAAQLNQLGRLTKLEGIHMTDIGAPPSTPPPPTPSPDKLDGRPDFPYTYSKSIGADHFNRLSSDSSDTTRFTFTVQNYTFYKTIRFTPQGEANINSTYTAKQFAEIGLRPTRGNAVDNSSRNTVAVQFSGTGGNFKIYRR
jgi:prepilin-type N-terminal cleavage/methylation domain-containing protein